MTAQRLIRVNPQRYIELPNYLDSWVVFIQELVDEVPKEYRASACLEVSNGYGDGGYEVDFYYYRPETPEEEAKRLEKERIRDNARERALYLEAERLGYKIVKDVK